MSDTTATDAAATATEAGTTAETTETTDTTSVDWQKEAEKWKALSRKNEANAKANAGAAQKLADIEASQLSDQERLTKRAEAAEKRAAELEAESLRKDVAAEKGVPANLLTGVTREELEAAADELIRFRGPSATTDFGVGKPTTKDIGEAKGGQLTRDQLKKMTSQEIVAADKAGRLNAIKGIS